MQPIKQSSAHNQSKQPELLRKSDPYKWSAVLVAMMVFITPVIVIGAAVGGLSSGKRHDGEVANVSEFSGGRIEQVSGKVSGQALYAKTCMVCHGDRGQGVPSLGKPLRNSAYVQGASDEQLFGLIATGRMPDDPQNTTGSLMPPRGAQNISDETIHAIVGFLREIQDESAPTASMDAWIIKTPGVETVVDADIPVNPGHEIYVTSCSACHGANGEGVEGLGKPFTTSVFVASSSDKELMSMIKSGRPIWDSANTTGIDMPPKGGNPALTDEQLSEIIGYIRSVSTITN